MRLAFLADTHTFHDKVKVEPCDILFFCGDWSFRGYEHETRAFAKWLNKQPAKHIVLTAGNHEKFFETQLPASRLWITEECPRAHLLLHEALELEGLKIFGSAITPTFFNWGFMADRGPEIARLWSQIPDDTQVLITHGPAMGILDQLDPIRNNYKIEHAGCQDLFERLKNLKDLKIHAFGHLHYQNKTTLVQDGVTFINAAAVDDDYKITPYPIITLDL